MLVLWLLLIVFFGNHEVAFADDNVQTESDNRYRWHLRSGLQVAHQCPDFRYDSVNRTKLRAWNDNQDIALTTFSFVSLQRELTDYSNIELLYSSDGKSGHIYGTARVRGGFFYLYPIVRVPLEIDVRTLKLQYSREIWQPERFCFGASIAVQALQISMNANLPRLFESLAGEDHFDYLVVVPSIGGFAEYRTKGSLIYRVSSEYMTVPLGDIEGKLIRADAGIEYQLHDHVVLGFGYRFSDTDVWLHEKKHDIKGSYEVHGYRLYTGINF